MECGKMSKLKEQIKQLILENPNLSDQEIAQLVTKPNGKHPTRAYVYKIRRKLIQEGLLGKEEQEETQEEPTIEIEEPSSDELLEFPTEQETFELEEQEQEQEVFDERDVAFMLELVFDRVADILEFDGFRLNEREKSLLAPVTKRMLDKYAPTILGNYSVELSFATTVLLVIGGKLAKYRKYKMPKEVPKIVEQPKEEKEELKTEIQEQEQPKNSKEEQGRLFKEIMTKKLGV